MKTVGILGCATGDPYSLRLMHTVASELVQQGNHAICFMGGFPDAPLYRDESNLPALPSSIDGWVLLSEALRTSAAELERMVRGARACVSIGLELAGIPSLTASNETGIFQAVAHLARRHERRRIAFVGGPSTSDDAARRLGAYRMAVESVGHQVDAALIADGNYDTRSGREAVRQLRRQAKKYDAVVAANDLMAIGVIEGLRANGQRVPEDVSVIGFDDMEEASFSSPTLTTVRQPLQEVGALAARLVLQRVAGAEVEPQMVTAPLVIRESCGCRSDSDGPDRRSLPPGVQPTRSQGLREGALREIVRRELASARTHRELGRLADGIVCAAGYPELAPILSEVCHLLGVRRLVLSTYSGGLRHARVTLESSGSSVVFHQRTEPHKIEQVLPNGFLRGDRPAQICVQTLELAGEHFGYVVIEGDVRDGDAYLDLRRSLSGALGRMAQGRELRRLYTAEKRKG